MILRWSAANIILNCYQKGQLRSRSWNIEDRGLGPSTRTRVEITATRQVEIVKWELASLRFNTTGHRDRQANTATATKDMGRMSLETRTKVITMRNAGLEVQQILKQLEEEGVSVSRMAIYSLCDKYQSTKSVVDLKRRAKPQLLEDCHYRFIDDAIADNVDMTSRQLLDFRVSRARVRFPSVLSSEHVFV